MTNFKKIFAIGTVMLAISVTSVTAFASQGVRGGGRNTSTTGNGGGYNVSINDPNYVPGTRYYANTQNPGNVSGTRISTGRGVTGVGRGLGIGGMMLQDGSCYAQ